MVNNRPFLPVAPATIDCVLQARIYLATKVTPSSVKIHTRSLTTNPQLDRSPSVESILEYSQLQPYVHDVLITSVVNMRSSDSKLADFVVKKILARVKTFQSPTRKRLPKEFKLVRGVHHLLLILSL
ncbi:hypothetical protein B0H14DRAFT_3436139 [Mycena olivaceomarginata]|nr:hypothetical protein B0H14DRAFT_3436139 [Mycena olivaceomarginata]